jgi:hypothetical protein
MVPTGMWADRYTPKTKTTLFQAIRESMNVKMGEGESGSNISNGNTRLSHNVYLYGDSTIIHELMQNLGKGFDRKMCLRNENDRTDFPVGQINSCM